MKYIDGGVCAAKGFKAAGLNAGIKNNVKKDMALVFSEAPCVKAGTFTTNRVCAAPVKWDKKVVFESACAQAIVVNSGIANACTGDEGYEKCRQMAAQTAAELGISEDAVLVASTGVIGKQLPMDIIGKGIKMLPGKLGATAADATLAAEAIMTTDTKSKQVAVAVEIDGVSVHIGGIAKGSGMIHPNMATMLCFITTDAAISADMLKIAVKTVADKSFNMVSVDGDTSTNDMLSVMANGLAKNNIIIDKDADYEVFKEALMYICICLSKGIAKDGEGATKLLTCTVSHACSVQDAKTVAKSVITSSLFKAAMFGKDANWGRILCAIGYCDASYDVDKIEVHLASQAGQILVCQNGRGYPFDEDEALKVLSEDEIDVLINLHDGSHHATAWGCDLTYDYVKINGDYRT